MRVYSPRMLIITLPLFRGGVAGRAPGWSSPAAKKVESQSAPPPTPSLTKEGSIFRTAFPADCHPARHLTHALWLLLSCATLLDDPSKSFPKFGGTFRLSPPRNRTFRLLTSRRGRPGCGDLLLFRQGPSLSPGGGSVMPYVREIGPSVPWRHAPSRSHSCLRRTALFLTRASETAERFPLLSHSRVQ
jgi:hypothetical protein